MCTLPVVRRRLQTHRDTHTPVLAFSAPWKNSKQSIQEGFIEDVMVLEMYLDGKGGKMLVSLEEKKGI